MEQDIRWIQRFDNFSKACTRILSVTNGERAASELSDLEQEGLIQRFEYTFELAWKTMQDYLRYLGFDFQPGPNSTIKLAFDNGIIKDHEGWRALANARIVTAHTYDEADAFEVVEGIYNCYAQLFEDLRQYLEARKEDIE